MIISDKKELDIANELTRVLTELDAEVTYELIADNGNKSFLNTPVKIVIHRNGKFQIVTEKIYKSLEKNFQDNKGKINE